MVTQKVFIIAEAGVNHNGDLALAKKMVDVACQAGADAVKFQTFKAENIVTPYAPKAEYQKRSSGEWRSQREMIKSLELDEKAHRELFRRCKERGIQFLSAPFDCESVDLLDRLGLSIFKIPSGEITNLPYLRKIGRLRKNIIMSTGMANLREVGRALGILQRAGTPREHITVLHCTSEYPSLYEDVNLRAMLTIKKEFSVAVGYSDHTKGFEVPIAAVALGASVIEKHFTLDKAMKGPDHMTSLDRGELTAMVRMIRNIELALGSAAKRASPSERKNIEIVRKSIVAACRIRKGERFSERNIAAKRPGSGISPTRWDTVIARVAKRDFQEDELIEL